MEELNNNKIYKFLFVVFVIFSLIYIGYATVTMRGLYMDGSFFSINLLENISNNNFKILYDPSHCRYMIPILMQSPVYFAGMILGIENKFALLMIYSFCQFFLPFAALLWNFHLTKRTGKIDVLFWSVFVYGAFLLPFSIFSLVEILIGGILQFILWNYLVSNVEYKKRDIAIVLFLVTMMYGIYEYVALFGVFIFCAYFYYATKNVDTLKSQVVKFIIGFGSLGAAVYNIIVMMNAPGEASEISRFLQEAHDFFPQIFNLNTLLTIGTLFPLVFFCFYKKKINIFFLIVVLVIYSALMAKLLIHTDTSVVPMWEGHLRTIPCWGIPLIFIIMFFRDFIQKEVNVIKCSNLLIVALICCIFQTAWQCVNTYYWDKNIQYMKSELERVSDLLYVPSQHEEISSFFNKKLRRYIWHGSYTATSVAFSDTYEQKTLLLLYDKPEDEGNILARRELFYSPEDKKISIPFGAYVSVKNKFWDLTKCAEELDKYNKENAIETYR